jgi:protoporphyrinogen IX oxidase
MPSAGRRLPIEFLAQRLATAGLRQPYHDPGRLEICRQGQHAGHALEIAEPERHRILLEARKVLERYHLLTTPTTRRGHAPDLQVDRPAHGIAIDTRPGQQDVVAKLARRLTGRQLKIGDTQALTGCAGVEHVAVQRSLIAQLGNFVTQRTGYLWLKAVHIIAVVTWFAALFYLPRLFVYHASTEDAIGRERFKVMEGKLYRIIMQPSMIVAVVFGLWLLALGWEAFSRSVWLWVKLAGVLALLGYHHYCARLVRDFAADRNRHSEKFYRMFNEVPAVLLIAIVVLVVVKPF